MAYVLMAPYYVLGHPPVVYYPVPVRAPTVCLTKECPCTSMRKRLLETRIMEEEMDTSNAAVPPRLTEGASDGYFDGEEKKDLPENANKDMGETKKDDDHKNNLEERSSSSDTGSSDGSGWEDGQTSDPDKDKFSGNGSSESGISGRGSPGGGNSSGDDTDNTVGSAVTDMTFVEEDSRCSLQSCPDQDTKGGMDKGSDIQQNDMTTDESVNCVLDLRHYTSMVTTSMTSTKSSIPAQSYITPCFQPFGMDMQGTSTHCTASRQSGKPQPATTQSTGMRARPDEKLQTAKDPVAAKDGMKDIQQAKMKRYQQVLEQLRKSGLFEVTLRTAKLMRQSRLIQAQINALRADAQRLSQSVVQDYTYTKTAVTSER
ncbi:protein starmaker-like isoform X1 [Branchiostoma lanceolatum]|uniref:protein starmaker-like isoform X1 n=2 Tax=Branchiostoma lanceolatum TaxID=7740 RepID=UPI0034520A3B